MIRASKMVEVISILHQNKYLKISFNNDVAIEVEEVYSSKMPLTCTPFNIILEMNKEEDFKDPDFLPILESICDDEMNLEYGEYGWLSPDEISQKRFKIFPQDRDFEIDFEDNTSQHIIVLLNLLSKDITHLASMIRLPQTKKYPKFLTVAVYVDGNRIDMLLDTYIVVDENEQPIYHDEALTHYLWSSFVIKALAKVYGSYAELENQTLGQLLKTVYGPAFLESQLGLLDDYIGTPIEKLIIKGSKSSIINL